MTIQGIVPGGKLTQDYGWTSYARSGAYGGNIHDGLDIGAPYGTRINWPLPPSSVRTGFEPGGYGKYTVGYSGPWEMLFGHEAQTGNNGFAGLVDSTGNSTGNHTHLRVKLNGVTVNPYILLNRIGGAMSTPDDTNHREDYARVLYFFGANREPTQAERRLRLGHKQGDTYGEIMNSEESRNALTALFRHAYSMAFGPNRQVNVANEIAPRVQLVIEGKRSILQQISEIDDSEERKRYLAAKQDVKLNQAKTIDKDASNKIQAL